eukprot:m.41483 g.41483  ORF g.41483 m.41483 type:complete len:260 (+) comp12836_c0_seq3:72-851(+)
MLSTQYSPWFTTSAMSSPYGYAGHKRYDNELDEASEQGLPSFSPSQAKRFRAAQMTRSPARSFKRVHQPDHTCMTNNVLPMSEGFETLPKRSKPCFDSYGQLVPLTPVTTPALSSRPSQPSTAVMSVAEDFPNTQVDNDDDSDSRPSLLRCLQRSTQPPLPVGVYHNLQTEARLQNQCYALVPYKPRDAFLASLRNPDANPNVSRWTQSGEPHRSLPWSPQTEPEIESPDEMYTGYYQGPSPFIEEVPLDEGMEMGMDL